MIPRRTVLLTLASAGLAAAAVAADTAGALAYQVRAGDTLWSISRRTGVSVQQLASRNHIADPDRIYAGQQLDVDAAPPAPAQADGPPVSPIGRPAARSLLVSNAEARGVDPNLVLALSMWESGWNQAMVSRDGAVGLMQIMPGTARWAGPSLLHRNVDVERPDDNVAVGTALLRHYMDTFHDPRLALAAYYQGEDATRKHGVYPSSRRYVDGILALRSRYAAGAA